jgi:type III secretory pathway component EscR
MTKNIEAYRTQLTKELKERRKEYYKAVQSQSQSQSQSGRICKKCKRKIA